MKCVNDLDVADSSNTLLRLLNQPNAVNDTAIQQAAKSRKKGVVNVLLSAKKLQGIVDEVCVSLTAYCAACSFA